ncbi:MAG: methyltransferase domain-containing protein [Steroidobacteraceae bacterium]
MGTYGRIVGLVRNKAIFDDYCRTHPIRKLHLGCGFVELDGWLNTDLLPRRSWVAYCNAAGKFPFPDGSFDYILTEHMIEHVDFDAGLQMLSECKRVLKPGGRIRISTPDLDKIMALKKAATPLEDLYIKDLLSHIPNALDGQPSFAINSMMRSWGHTFIYDQETLSAALLRMGFVGITLCTPGQSADRHLDGVDRHADTFTNPDFNLVESLVLEASTPGQQI